MTQPCKGCGEDLHGIAYHETALSRYKHGKICSDCGVREAIDGDFIKEQTKANLPALRK